MKKSLWLSLAALTLFSCSEDEFFGTTPEVQPPSKEDLEVAIGFGSEARNATRAPFTGSDAAEKLNSNFIVYGFKTTATTEAVDGTGDNKVFNLYNVNYEAGTANTTESNTADWEYVGINSHLDEIQTIKYWDLSAKSYVFSAVSGTGIKATKIEKAADGSALAYDASSATLTVNGTATVRDKGWVVEVPAGGSLSDLYASDRLIATADGTAPAMKYQDKVDLTFRALGTKIRFAIYEVVPGYTISIDRVWYHDGTEDKFSDTDFYIKGEFNTANPSTTTPLIVTYDENDRAKVSYNSGDVTTLHSGKFGSNLINTVLGESTVEATYDQADRSYTYVLPYQNPSNVLKLKVNYTLTSTDSSHEKIKVYGATAYVPAQYTQWKPNYAYTYIFKISDKSNGTTVEPNDPDDPNDPVYNDPDDSDYDPNDPNIGLSPITFDAVVITDEDDVQETITTVAEPSFTTYAEGIDATANTEYRGGEDVYVNVMDHNTLATLTSANFHIYEVNNLTPNNFEQEVTEAMLENYMNNFCVLTEVQGVNLTVTSVPLTSGYSLTFAAGQVAKFTPVAGKIYAAEYITTARPAAYTAVAATTTLTAGKTYYTANDGTGAFTADGSEVADGTNYFEMTTKPIAAKKSYKVIKTTGAASANNYYFTTSGTPAIVAVNGEAVYNLYDPTSNAAAIGAAKLFKVYDAASKDVTNNFVITDNLDGTYSFKLTADAVAAGADGAYTVKFTDTGNVLNVNLTYALVDDATNQNAKTSVTVIAGNTTGDNVTLMVANAAYAGAKMVCSEPKLHIADMGAGVYNVTADADLAFGSYSATIGGETLAINVDSYAFAADLVITNQLGGGSTGILTLQKNGAALPAATATAPAILWADLTKSSGYATAADGTDVTPAVNGQYLLTANTTGTAGYYYITYENAKAKVTVNSYAISAPASIAQFSGAATLEVKCGSTTTINANTNDLVVTTPDAVLYADENEYNTAKSTNLTAAQFAALPTCEKVKAAGTAPYTVVTNGQTIKFSNATATGTYTFNYKVKNSDDVDVIVAEATVVVL